MTENENSTNENQENKKTFLEGSEAPDSLEAARIEAAEYLDCLQRERASFAN